VEARRLALSFDVLAKNTDISFFVGGPGVRWRKVEMKEIIT
jgi:hypothetical protein